MKLQIALDRLGYDECFEITSEVHEHVDIIEVGTGVIKEYGLGIVRDLKTKYPDISILADVKICDAGKSESEKSFEYLSDLITVMALADINTVRNCQEVADRFGKTLVVDLLNIKDFSLLDHLKEAGVRAVSLHVGKDQREADMKPAYDKLKEYDFDLFVAGGINEDNLKEYLKFEPDVVIVGSGITQAKDKVDAAKTLKSAISEFRL
ncbi:3-hexulose-6-phosphate synthase [Salinicoccus hispanicus]|uniref:3-hexulose-6-phosphate synthase n=1 Tax=Salinicoccus hispanicus TaxID=157225 RepID=A0A6N8U229_9STAP|nr:3-hexulose-6-phosphate synthase [Salinicoccus hispanicus]MXQ51387.1 hypothetical protein [Salinicoccus hispanicus]